ncbi:MAG: class I SAM-dependent DNA methyltransferase, partial [Betaproteobacteria bacterium]
EKTIHDHGLVSVLRELHDDLDRAVFAAYGWDDLAAVLVGKPGATTPYPEKSAEQAAAEEELLSRLVALNAERAAEEARGLVRWLRPEIQAAASTRPVQGEIETDEAVTATDGADTVPAVIDAPSAGKRAPWPATLPEQIRVVADALAAAPQGLDLDQLAAQFSGRGPWKKRLPDIVDSLAALGRVKAERVGERTVLRG